MTPLLMGLLLAAAAEPCPGALPCVEENPGAGPLSLPPILSIEEAPPQPETKPVPLDRAALELRAAEARARRAREADVDQRAAEPSVERQSADGDEQSAPDPTTPSRAIPPAASKAIPPPDLERGAVVAPGASAQQTPPAAAKNPTLGPTAALFLSGMRQVLPGGASSGKIDDVSLGGRLGLRYMPESAPAAALSLAAELSLGAPMNEVGLVGRVELIARATGAMIPGLRLGGFVQPLMRFDPSSAWACMRTGLVLGWCLPAAFMGSYGGVGGNAVLGVANVFGGFGLIGAAAGALLISPELTLSYEATGSDRGMITGTRLSVGVGF